MLCVHECGLVYVVMSLLLSSVVMSLLLSSVWCVCMPGVLVFSERWRQRLACILWEAEFVLFEKQRQRQRQILYSLKGGGRGVRVYYIFERQRQVWHEWLNQESSAQLNEASGLITGKWGILVNLFSNSLY